MNVKGTIDFETRSRCDLKKSGAWAYSEHESTQVLCLAYRLPGSKVRRVWSPFLENLDGEDGIPEDLAQAVKDGASFEAHNAWFEYCIWENVLHARLGFPRLELEKLFCSASAGAALALPRRLEDMARVLNARVEKDMEGHKLMMRMSKPKKKTKKDPSEWVDDQASLFRLMKYCVGDIAAEDAVSNIIGDLPPDELQVFRLDQQINARGILCDRPLVEKALSFANAYERELVEELVKITDGEVKTGNQVAAMREWLSSYGLDLDNLQSHTITEALEDSDFLEPEVKRVLQIRQALGRASTKKLKAMLATISKDDRIRGTLRYHGAATGRWAGQGIQPQNFPRGNKDVNVEEAIELINAGDYHAFRAVYPDVLDALSSCLRGMLIASPGHRLIAGDFSAIEARKLAWLAGAVRKIEAFELFDKGLGPDQYVLAYSDSFSVPIDKVTKDQRQIGKVAELALGYQGGKGAFQSMAKNYGMKLPDEEAERVKVAWRNANPDIVAFWYALEGAALQAIQNPGQVFKAGKHIAFKFQGLFLWCRLPSGRKLAYYRPQVRPTETKFGIKMQISYEGVDTYTRKWQRTTTYGGKLAENVTQAVSRDYMAYSMIQINDAGYPAILTVHDEVVTDTPNGHGSVEHFEEIMTKAPTWAKGCPVKVEAWEGQRYKK